MGRRPRQKLDSRKQPKGELPVVFDTQREALDKLLEHLRPIMDAGWKIDGVQMINVVGEPLSVLIDLSINKLDVEKWVC